MREYYPCCASLRGGQSWFVYYTNDADGILLSPDRPGFLAAPTLSRLLTIAGEQGIVLDDEVARYDLDGLLQIAADPNRPDTTLLLNSWNLTQDVERSLGLKSRFLRAEALRRVYDKLFWAQNLPSVTPEGCRYEPIWTERELRQLARVARHCVNRLEREFFRDHPGAR
jgi:hypothetical protein